jgi:hypothetical protein
VLEEGFRVTDGSIRFLAGLSLAALAAITGIVSYLHALTVVYITGSAGLVAYLIPFVADLMIVTASLAILDAIRHHAPKPPLAMVSLVAGIGSTLAMNIVAGLHISAGGALVAALPPVAFVLSLETLMGIVRLARAGDGASHLTATDGQCPHQVAMSAEDAGRRQPTSNARRCCARWWAACPYSWFAAARTAARPSGTDVPSRPLLAAGADGLAASGSFRDSAGPPGRSGGVRSRRLRPVRPQTGAGCYLSIRAL